MHWIDIVVIAVVVLSALVSFWRGFIREVLSLLVWVAAVFLAFKFFPYLEPKVAEWIPKLAKEPILLSLATGVGLLIIALFVLGIISYLISNVLIKKSFGIGDRLLAAVLGLARGVLLVGIAGVVVIAIDDSLETQEPKADTILAQSQIWPHSRPLSIWLKNIGVEYVDELNKTKPTKDTEVEVDIFEVNADENEPATAADSP